MGIALGVPVIVERTEHRDMNGSERCGEALSRSRQDRSAREGMRDRLGEP